MKVRIVCPYCEHENNIHIEPKPPVHRPEVLLCDNTDGGCDTYFVYVLVWKYAVDTRRVEEGNLQNLLT